jgi:heme A synthase
MESILKHAHSGLRWFALGLLVYAIINALMKRKNGTYTDNDKLVSVLTLSFIHLQVVIGLVLYFMQGRMSGFSEMSVSSIRLYSLEHPLMMLIAAILITVGHSKSKKAREDAKKFKATYVFFSLALVLILSRIPWPFIAPGAGWF